ncbi:MAG: sulfatase-like hydrolase/transferase, partial [Myxococcales bacterium]|nr:sulfatase-like hydrolase/transferase [Myxococcales bacterium]
LPSFASMFTGLDLFQHRAGEPVQGGRTGRRPLAREFDTLAERLRENGWQTIAWINNPYLTRTYGLDQGFRRFVDYGTRSAENASQGASDDVIRELLQPRAHDRFFFVHLMDPHGPYLPNADFRKRLLGSEEVLEIEGKRHIDLFRDLISGRLDPTPQQQATYQNLYDAVLAYADSQISRIFEAFRAFEAPGRSLLIVTADHGEEFWEHGTYEHGHTLYDELLAVPLVLYAPNSQAAGSEISTAVSLKDVMPTVLDFAGLEAPTEDGAISLLPQLAGTSPPADRALVASNLLYGAQRLAISRGPLKYIYNSRGGGVGSTRAPLPASIHEFYDLAADPAESTNRFASDDNRFPHDGERVQALHQELARRSAPRLAGDFVVYYQASAKAPNARLRGTIRVGGGAAWNHRVHDLLWPGDGQQGSLSLRFERRPDGEIAHFELEAPRALLGFSIAQGSGPVSLSLTLEGEPISADAIEVGAKRSRPKGRPFPIPTDPLDRLSAERFVERHLMKPAGPSLHVVVAKLSTPLDEEASISGGNLPADVRRQLEELGYLEPE